ncbi:M16 family metallopeptidase [Nannocystis radixulma]|uniref:Pitrilysin family protein n=1 Tax=Nannocystis radixulma TaxID=2995305 RepID=A0ABT5BKC8_9BACT|nr:pitrilysin family protein [Nannocystis radixulma]MDC0674562.1 pitrilysin family protein [Nannocystis radixulma]
MPDLPVSPPSPRGLDLPGAASEFASLIDERLANGARLLILPARPAGPGPAAIQLWVGSGTAAERPDEHGCAHLLEHMLFKPCALGHGPKSIRARLAKAGVRRTEPALDLAGAIEALGGDINAFTSHDETVVHVTAPAARAAEAAALIAAATLHPTLDSTTLAQEREVVIEEIKQYDDDPGQRVTQAALGRVYGTHAYARPVLGLEAEVAGHTAARLRAYHRRAYAGERLTLVAVGAVDVAALRKVARATVGALPAAPARRPTGEPAPRPGVTVKRAEVQEAYVLLAWPAPAAGAADAAAIDVAAVVLGNGESSRLVAETRRKEQVVSDIQAHCDTLRLGGSLLVSARTTAAQAAAAVTAVLTQVRRLAAASVSPEELARAKAILESDLVYRRETVQGQAHALGACATIFGDLAREREYYAALAALTPEAVRSACARWLDPAHACVSLELPRAEVDVAKARSVKTAVDAARKPAEGPRRGGPAPKRAPDGIDTLTLPNGLRLLARVERAVPVAAGWLIWPGGQRREPVALAGSNSVAAALLTRGNARLDGEALSRAIDGMAAGLDGFAGRNSLGLHFECLARHFPAVLGHALDCTITPTFAAAELDEERRVALQDLAAEVDDAGQVASRGLHKLLYGEHPFSRPVRGTPEGLRALTPAKLKALWRRDYPIGQAVLALAGDVDVAAAAAQVEAALREAGLWDRVSEGPGKAKPVQAPRGPREREIFQDREQAHIALGWPGIAVGDAREPTLDVLSAVLGGQTGRLFTALREVQGLVYEVSMSSVEGVDAGHVAIHASTSQDKLPKALAAIAAEVERAVREPPSPAEVARAQAWLVGQFELGQQRRSRMASLLALSEVYGLPRARAFAYPQRVRAVTPEAVWTLARTLFRPQVAARCVVRAKRRK